MAFRWQLRVPPCGRNRWNVWRSPGRLDGTLKASWRGSMQALQVRSDATITAQAPWGRSRLAGSSAIPLDGAVHLAYDGSSDVVSLQQYAPPHAAHHSYARRYSGQSVQPRDTSAGQTICTKSICWRSPCGDLLAAQTQPASKPPELLGLGGSVSFNGQLQGSMKEPRLTGQLGGENVRYRGHNSAYVFGLELDLSSSGIALRQGRLQTGSQGRVEFDMAVGLRNWSYERENPVSLRVVANRSAGG